MTSEQNEQNEEPEAKRVWWVQGHIRVLPDGSSVLVKGHYVGDPFGISDPPPEEEPDA